MMLSVGDCGAWLMGGGVGVRATLCMCLVCEVSVMLVCSRGRRPVGSQASEVQVGVRED
jgi:methyl coenzyme M reductase subunit C